MTFARLCRDLIATSTRFLKEYMCPLYEITKLLRTLPYMKKSIATFFLFSILALTSCADNEALRGRIILTLTDAPSDSDQIKEVNISITSIEVLHEGDQAWQIIKSFEDPLTIDLLEYTQGEYYDLTEQYLTPGKYTGLRLQLNIANVDNGLTVFPQSNLVFTDGTQETLFVEEGLGNYVEVMRGFEIATNETTFFTLDFDVRKSIIVVGGEYKLRPSMRIVDTSSAGGIDGQFRDFPDFDKVVAFAYASGSFTAGEITHESAFENAISSALVRNDVGGRFYISFLPAGSYDLIFAHIKVDGSVDTVLGKLTNVSVESLEDTFTCVQLTTPDVQGNCRQVEAAL